MINNKLLKNNFYLSDKKNPYKFFSYKHIKNLKKILQFAVKKGKKETVEKNVRKALFFSAKTKKIKFSNILNDTIINTTPYISVKTKRRGSKNIYVPMKIKKSYSEFLSSIWILESINKRTENQFYKKLVNELIDISSKKSNASKKKNELHKLASDNLRNR